MTEPKEVANPISPRDQVIAWLLEGPRDADIKEAIAKRWPGIDAHTLAVSAVEHFARAANCDRRVVIGWAMEAYKDLYRRQLAIGDFANAMKAVKELTALATKHDVYRDNDRPADGESAVE